MKTKCNLIIAVAALLAVAARADDLADKGRQIFNTNQHAVVTIQAVVKSTYASGSHSSEPTEVKTDVTGTVLDPSGLIVLALSSVDPSDLYHQLSEKYKMETEVGDLKIMLDDGTEIPAEIVLRDKDLDLAYLRPKSKLSSPMSSVDFTKSSAVEVMDPLIVLNRLNRAAGRAYAAGVGRIAAVIRKPRTYYVPDGSSSSSSLGSPAFALNGNIVGIFVMRAVNAGDSNSRNMREYMTAILVPAEDIMKGAKQAPEVKAETAKPAVNKDTK